MTEACRPSAATRSSTGHLIGADPARDRTRGHAANVARFSLTGTAAGLRERAAALAADGVGELAIQPGGDVPAELRRLAGALLG